MSVAGTQRAQREYSLLSCGLSAKYLEIPYRGFDLHAQVSAEYETIVPPHL